MTESEIQSAQSTLHEIASHAYSLAMGLQNAAPAPASASGTSIQYLKEISIYLDHTSQKISALLSHK